MTPDRVDLGPTRHGGPTPAPAARGAARGPVLLVSPPWTAPQEGNLAVATLQGLLRQAGFAVETLYGNLCFSPLPGAHTIPPRYGAFFFTPWLYADVSVDQATDEAVALIRHEADLEGLFPSEIGAVYATDAFRASVREHVLEAGRCVARMAARLAHAAFVGFSCTFEAQLVSALAVASRLRAESPELPIALGGAACFGETAEALLEAFPCVDAVCFGEGEHVIAPLVDALVAGAPLDDVRGVAFRAPDGAVRRTAPAPLNVDLDRLPLPDYRDLVAQLAASPWRGLPPRLFFETSRGCWWGQKHLCTFCGLNAEGLAFRRKSPARAVAEITALLEAHPDTERLMATDNILDMGYFEQALPAIAELRRARAAPLNLFYEIKSNLDRGQIAQLADAGITAVQPGIESFSDGVLALMNKGATGLQQVQCVKWLHEEGIAPEYNLLVRSPGERAEHYAEISALLPSLVHLPPPHVGVIWLERFSPYWSRPDHWGITAIRPKPYYRTLYRGQGVDHARLAYVFDYDHAEVDAPDLGAARAEVIRQVLGWRALWRPGLAHYTDRERHVVIEDHRGVLGPLTARLSGVAAVLWRALDRQRGLAGLRAELPDVDHDALDAALAVWTWRRWVVRDRRGRSLAVLPRRRDAGADARGEERVA